jgi:hypothetical protein
MYQAVITIAGVEDGEQVSKVFVAEFEEDPTDMIKDGVLVNANAYEQLR